MARVIKNQSTFLQNNKTNYLDLGSSSLFLSNGEQSPEYVLDWNLFGQRFCVLLNGSCTSRCVYSCLIVSSAPRESAYIIQFNSHFFPRSFGFFSHVLVLQPLPAKSPSVLTVAKV